MKQRIRSKHALSTFCMITIVFLILSPPFVRSQTATSRTLGIKPQLDRKDTYMLDLQYPLTGPDAWDTPHNNTSTDDDTRGIKAVISMVDSYYGGHLSQDYIMYHVFHEVLNYPSPYDDLGNGSGNIPFLNVADLLIWALPGAGVARVMGKPDFSEIQYWIDSGCPIVRDAGAPEHFITLIDGYYSNSTAQMVEVINPSTGNETMISYDSLTVFVLWIVVPGNQITPRSDPPTIWTDSDGDGVVDFDKINRFDLDPYVNNTYGPGIPDKAWIEYTYVLHRPLPAASFKHSPETWVNGQLTFDASGSIGNITSYEWNFGDNNVTTVTTPVINHTYHHPGNYSVTLKVTDNNGLWKTTTSLITIEAENGEFEYPSYRQSPDRDGSAPNEGPETPSLLWTSNLNHSTITSPIVADGTVFVGTSGGTLYALNLTNGDTVWTFNAGSPISSSPAFQNGTVFFTTGQSGEVYALDAQTGLIRWLYNAPAGVAVDCSPAVVDGRVLISCSDGALLCLNQSKGQVLWDAGVNGWNVTSPAVQNNLVFVTTSRGADAVDMLTGTLIWEYESTWPIISSPAVADGLVFVGSQNNDHVYALNENNGSVVWSYWVGGWLTPPAVDTSRQVVIAGSRDSNLYCLDEQNGSLVWSYLNGPNYLSAPTISANGLVYVGYADGSLHCINETNGDEVWKYNISALPIISSPCVIYEHVLVGSQEGKIYCFGPPFPVHNITNISISNLTLSKPAVGRGYGLKINATVDNHGGSAETFNVTAYANGTAIHTEEVTLMNGTSTTITFTWNTTGFAYGNYKISAYAWPVPGETNTANNNRTGGTVKVTIPGDANGDGVVDAQDFYILERAWGTSAGQKNYDPRADFNGDGVIDAQDFYILEVHWGMSVAL